MKQFLRYIFLLVAFLTATTNAWAECYAFEESTAYSKKLNQSQTYNLGGKPGAILSFEAKKASWGTGNLRVDQYVNGKWEEGIWKDGLSKDWKVYTNIPISRYATEIRLYNTGTLAKDFKNIKITWATYADAPTKSTWTTETRMLGASSQSTSFSMNWSNTPAFQATLSGDGESQFSVSISNNASTCSYGTAQFSITYNHTQVGTHNATLTISNGTYSYTLTLKGHTIDKNTANFSWVAINNTGSNTGTWYVDDSASLLSCYNLKDQNGNTLSNANFHNNITFTTSAPNVIAIENGNMVAKNAGTATVTAHFAGTSEWKTFTKELNLTILKHNIVATINPNNAVWNDLITNPFSATSTHPITGQVTPIPTFTVTQQDNKHIALMDVNSRNIQTYYTNGDVNFLITRPADYKYNALSQTLTLHVNQSTMNCPILDVSEQRNWETIGNSGTYTIPSGTPDSLFFQARRTDILGVTNTTEFYAEYSSDNNTWTEAMKINLPDKGTWYNLKCDIPETAKYVRFVTYMGAMGNKHIRNVRITRAKELTPSDSPVILPVTSIGTPETKTFTLKWSTCADEILLTKSNPHFTINTHNISSTAGQGTTAITVTCDASVVGTLRDTIVIYDQTQRIFVPVVCEVNDKFIANIKGTTAYSKKVDDTWVADFKFDTCQTTLPSDDINAPFYYTIKDDLTGNDVQNLEYKDQVISYNPQNYTITAHNAGTAVLTFIQKPTESHYTDTLRCVITVSKYDAELNWKDPVYYNDTISNYFTTTDTISPIVIVSQTDTDVAKLTNEFNPTSNNSLDLITFNKEASTTVTVSQKENYKWNGYSKDTIITPIDPNNHVTFTIDSQERRDIFDVNWNANPYTWDNGIQMGDWLDGTSWADKYVDLHFTGIPDKLTFNTTIKNATDLFDVTGVYWYVKESTDGVNWSDEIWSRP